MPPTRRTIATLGVAVVAFAAGCTAPAARVSPDLPPVEAFKTGVCRDIAEPLRTLGQFTWQHDGAARLTPDQRVELRPISERLAAAQVTAAPTDPALANQIATLVGTIGVVRLIIADTYKPDLLRSVETSRREVQATCTEA